MRKLKILSVLLFAQLLLVPQFVFAQDGMLEKIERLQKELDELRAQLAGNAIAKVVKVKIHRHPSVSISEERADQLLLEMGQILQKADSPADVATAIKFERDGPVRLLPGNVPAVIQTSADFGNLLAADSGIKVVRKIRWCGKPGATIIGCAPVGSPEVNLGVVPFQKNQEAIVWTHEYGHNAGLHHRTDDQKALMYPSVGANHKVVNKAESKALIAGPAALEEHPQFAALEDDLKFPEGAKEVDVPKDVKSFVRRHYFHGVPFKAASSYTKKDSVILLKMLENPVENEQFLPEIVTTICYIGDEDAVDDLIAFVENSKLDGEAAFDAKNAILIHLGDLVNKTQNKKAVQFLSSIASGKETAEKLSKSRFEAIAPGDLKLVPISKGELRDELAVSAAQGLAIAGTLESKKAIESLSRSTNLLQAVGGALPDLRKISEEIDKKGLQTFRSHGH